MDTPVDVIKITLTFPDGTTKELPEPGMHITTFTIQTSDGNNFREKYCR